MSLLLSQETHHGLQEGGWAFLVGHVLTVGYDHELGIWQLAREADALLCRDDAVVVAGDDQNGVLLARQSG
jgi:hypothetical protein